MEWADLALSNSCSQLARNMSPRANCQFSVSVGLDYCSKNDCVV